MPRKRDLLTRKDILKALDRLSEILESRGVKADVYVIRGAAMALAFKARLSTRDVDAVFKWKNEVYKAAAQVAREQGLPDGWLNDGAKKDRQWAPIWLPEKLAKGDRATELRPFDHQRVAVSSRDVPVVLGVVSVPENEHDLGVGPGRDDDPDA